MGPRSPLAVVLCAFVVLAPPLAARGAAEPITIASIPIDTRVDLPPAFNDGTGRFTLSMTPISTIRLFSDVRISALSVGATLVATADSDPHFAEFARQMTNGRGNYIEWLFGPRAGTGAGVGSASEAALFGLPPGLLDFRGFEISSLTLSIDSFSAGRFAIVPTFSEFAFTGRLSVLGQGAFDPVPVPEPATLTLLATGALGLFGVLRGRR